MKGQITYNYLENYLIEIQSKGRYALTLDELKSKFDISEKAILQNVYRLKSKNQLAQVRQGFYVIIPPQYSNMGMLPPTLFIDDMMRFLKREYYVGLFSAAALHGAAHQQPMEFQVMTKKPALRNIKNKKLSINFITLSTWNNNQICEKKTQVGYLKLSSPELTVFDLISHHKNIGGLNRIIPVIDELLENIPPTKLKKIVTSQRNPTIQRLGFLLDKMDNISLSNILHKHISIKSLKEIPISLAHNNRTGLLNKKWKVIINSELDI